MVNGVVAQKGDAPRAAFPRRTPTGEGPIG